MSHHNPATLDSILNEINSQTKGQPPDSIEELNLDTLDLFEITPELQLKLEEYTNLMALTLNECSLNTLENFPKLPNLARLELCDNKLKGSALKKLEILKSLQSLALGGNELKNIDDLIPLKQLENLTDLDLLGCEMNFIENYREVVFAKLPHVLILDNCDREGNDLDVNNDEEETNERLAKEMITKEVIIVDSSDEDLQEIKKPKKAEEYFRKEVFKEKVQSKFETFEILGKKKPRSDSKEKEDENGNNLPLKKVKL